VIFPEGGRSTDGFLQPFKPGVARMALAIGTKIVPVTINGAFSAWPRHHMLPRLSKVTVIYHPPITVVAMNGAHPTEVHTAARELSKNLKSAIASSLDSQYLPKDHKENVLSSEF
jgi:1-acyl-sn-glycerol-3-phosphate acyltransferase